jgi:rhodanese-related sulfurtransferase
MSGRAYSGDVSVEDAWKALKSESGAALIDVRTTAEWNYVGMPDIAASGAPLFRIEWQSYPSMQVNQDFVAAADKALRDAGRDRAAPVFFICRSGARSAAAAAAMTAAGYSRCFNVAGGFEGQRDQKGHRGTVDGWKAAKLPWVQP